MEQAEKAKSNNKGEKDLKKDEKTTEEQFLLAQRMLSHATNCLSTAIANKNMVELKVANELLHSAQQGYEKASVHRERIEKGACQYWFKKEKSHGTVSQRSKRSKTVKKFKKLPSGIL